MMTIAGMPNGSAREEVLEGVDVDDLGLAVRPDLRETTALASIASVAMKGTILP